MTKTTYMLLATAIFINFFTSNKAYAQTGDPLVAPYNALMIEQDITDYTTWYDSVLLNKDAWQAAGLGGPAFARNMDNPYRVLTYYSVWDTAKARAFINSPALQQIMHNAGVKGDIKTLFLHVEYDLNTIMEQDRLFITQHVTNYETWKNAFDHEDRKNRLKSGLVDRTIAHSLDDPQLVVLFFGITNLDKARAYIKSPDYNKFCVTAGIDQEPTITWYEWNNYKGWYRQSLPAGNK